MKEVEKENNFGKNMLLVGIAIMLYIFTFIAVYSAFGLSSLFMAFITATGIYIIYLSAFLLITYLNN